MKFMFGLQHPLKCKLWTTLLNPCNKVRGKYISKEVFLRPLFLRLPSFMRLNYGVVVMLHEYVYVYTSIYMYISAWISRWVYNNITAIKNIKEYVKFERKYEHIFFDHVKNLIIKAFDPKKFL